MHLTNMLQFTGTRNPPRKVRSVTIVGRGIRDCRCNARVLHAISRPSLIACKRNQKAFLVKYRVRNSFDEETLQITSGRTDMANLTSSLDGVGRQWRNFPSAPEFYKFKVDRSVLCTCDTNVSELQYKACL
jgi:hypothetical protein